MEAGRHGGVTLFEAREWHPCAMSPSEMRTRRPRQAETARMLRGSNVVVEVRGGRHGRAGERSSGGVLPAKRCSKHVIVMRVFHVLHLHLMSPTVSNCNLGLQGPVPSCSVGCGPQSLPKTPSHRNPLRTLPRQRAYVDGAMMRSDVYGRIAGPQPCPREP